MKIKSELASVCFVFRHRARWRLDFRRKLDGQRGIRWPILLVSRGCTGETAEGVWLAGAMGYEHDIFISYRRNQETLSWLTEHFVPLLELRVELELGRRPKIYVDSQIESGSSWPLAIGAALGNSRILIPLWTGNYLSSKWCVEEFSRMLARERETNLRTPERPNGIIVPAFVHNGEKFPPELGHIQYFEIQRCFNVRMQRNSQRAEELDAILATQAPAIKKCIESAPSCLGAEM